MVEKENSIEEINHPELLGTTQFLPLWLQAQVPGKPSPPSSAHSCRRSILIQEDPWGYQQRIFHLRRVYLICGYLGWSRWPQFTTWFHLTFLELLHFQSPATSREGYTEQLSSAQLVDKSPRLGFCVGSTDGKDVAISPFMLLTPSKYCSAREMPCSCPLLFTYVAWKNILGEDILGTGAEMSLSLLIWDLLPLNTLRVNMKSHSLRAEVGPCFFPWLWFPSFSKTNETAFPLFFLIFSHLPRLCFHLPSEWLSYYSFTEL